VQRVVRLAVNGEVAGAFRDIEGNSWPVTVRLPSQGSQPISALNHVYVSGANGSAVPLAQFSRPQLKSSPPQISRLKLQRTVTVTAHNQPGLLTSKVNADVQRSLAKISLPAGYAFSAGGEAEAAERSLSGLATSLVLALFGVFAVLVLEFRRFRETAVVAGVVPLGMLGGLLALLLAGQSLSFLALIGFIALLGIEIKNSILLVDFTTQLRSQGFGLRAAIERAGVIRFLPVLLTSVTAICGLLPLALSGSQLYSPLAWVIIGGLVTSTLLSRLITPAMYLIVARENQENPVAKL
jgi:multidrug efflux pump subunit AcrB